MSASLRERSEQWTRSERRRSFLRERRRTRRVQSAMCEQPPSKGGRERIPVVREQRRAVDRALDLDESA